MREQDYIFIEKFCLYGRTPLDGKYITDELYDAINKYHYISGGNAIEIDYDRNIEFLGLSKSVKKKKKKIVNKKISVDRCSYKQYLNEVYEKAKYLIKCSSTMKKPN